MEGLGLKYVFGKPLKGWLRQQGGKKKGWQSKFFVLDSGRLSCFPQEDDVISIKTYTLKDYELKELPKSIDATAFELISDKGNGESFIFRASTEEERKEWIKALRYTICGDTGGGIFGLPLEDLMKSEGEEGRNIPYVVEACVKHLELYAKQTEGVFRLPGRAGLVKELRRKFEMGERPSLDNVDVHTVGSLLKSYLRDLPESLVLPKLYQRAMNLALRYSDANSDEIRTEQLVGLSSLLKEESPDAIYTTLVYICRFLHDLVASAEKTKMDSRNLSLILGPTLIRHMDDNPELLMATSDLTQHLAYMLIHHCNSVFPSTSGQEMLQTEAAGDQPVMRKETSAQDNVTTADLLQLSAPLDRQTDTSKCVSQPTALGDLMGMDFSHQQDEVFDGDKSATSSNHSSFVLSTQFEASSLSVSQRGDGSTSSEASGGIGFMDTGIASSPNTGTKPVRPKRNKTTTLKRNRASAHPLPSQLNPEPFCQLYFQDTMTATSMSDVGQNLHEKKEAVDSVSIDDSSESGTQRTQGLFVASNSCSSLNKHKNEIKSSSLSDLVTSANILEDITVGRDSAKLFPSRTMLEVQVIGLKNELIGLKAKYDSLKNILTDERSRYESKITSMEKKHADQMRDLAARLAAENKARAEAVDKTVCMQTELFRYQMKYGELHDSTDLD